MTQQIVTLNVEGMSCEHCSGMVQKTLENIEGLSNISVDLERKKASFMTKDNLLIEKAVEATINAGYRASKVANG